MIAAEVASGPAEKLRALFGDRLQEQVPLAPFTSSRIGGPAEFLVEVRSVEDLARTAGLLWSEGVGFRVLGGGSNLLVSDKGVLGVVILNHARSVEFILEAEPPMVRCASGSALGSIARRCARRGLAGLEWAVSVPGTVGGAIVGNAGAHGGEIATSLAMADILQPDSAPERWSPERFQFAYRQSWLKRHSGAAVVLSAHLKLERSTPEQVEARMATLVEHRKETQPSGASWGSIFRNPPGDYAGRLIEAAGLKGRRIGSAMISSKHGNFFLNLGDARAKDVCELIRLTRETVYERSGVLLELEIELIGDWS